MEETHDKAPAEPEASSETELLRHRRESFERIGKLGDLYPFDFRATSTVSSIAEKYAGTSGDELERSPVVEAAAGRILARRVQGKAGFLDLSDGLARLQVYVRKDVVGEPGWELFSALDLGDWIGAEG
jgi:lysyl-tRNA synthetase, class II